MQTELDLVKNEKETLQLYVDSLADELASKIFFICIIDFSIEPRTESTHMPVLIKLPIKLEQSVKSTGTATYKANEETSTFSRKKEDIINKNQK